MFQIRAPFILFLFPFILMSLLISPGVDGCFWCVFEVKEEKPQRQVHVRRVRVIGPPPPSHFHQHYNSGADISHHHSGDCGSHGPSAAYSTATNQNPVNHLRPHRRSINDRRGNGPMQPPPTQQISRRRTSRET